jgi:hypothetical protein
VLLPQATSRLVSVYVFAVAAQRCSAAQLGTLAIGTAVASMGTAVSPALVGKPLASLNEGEERHRRGPQAQSAAIAAAVLIAVLLAAAAALTDGLTRLALVGGAIGLPAVMVVESSYWRQVFTDGAPPAGVRLSAAYVAQALVVTAAALWAPVEWVVLSPFVGLLLVSAVVLATTSRQLSLRGAREWAGPLRPTWLPYVLGVGAGIALVQAIPPVLAATAGLAATSVYRAGELAFGGANLVIGVVGQTFLTQGSARPRRAYLRGGLVGVVVALANGLVLYLLPTEVLRVVVGPLVAPLLDVLPVMTAQRAALALTTVGAMLLVPLISARRHGSLDVVAAALALGLLVGGGVLYGLEGAIAGLAIAEAALAVLYLVLLRAATRDEGVSP